MRVIVVLSFELAEPEQVADIILAIDPPRLPRFANEARISIGEPAQRVLDYLDAKEGDL